MFTKCNCCLLKTSFHPTLGPCFLAQLGNSSNENPKPTSSFSGHWNFGIRSVFEVNWSQLSHSREELPPCTSASLFLVITAGLPKHFVILNPSAGFSEEMSDPLDSSKPSCVILSVCKKYKSAAQMGSGSGHHSVTHNAAIPQQSPGLGDWFWTPRANWKQTKMHLGSIPMFSSSIFWRDLSPS